MSNLVVNCNFPKKLQPLFKPARYKILYGGRGGAKSWGVARALLLLGTKKPLRILCVRELQKSITDSVHKLLSDQISALGLDPLFNIQKASIKGVNGTEFFFAGLKHNTNQIKSFEGIDIVWVEEASTVSKPSWDVLIPTIRKDDSEIWVTFNPELEEDETYQRFVLNPPDSAVRININHKDNPYFPEVLRDEMEHCKKVDPDGWLNVWEGHPIKIIEGAIYGNELRRAQEEGRICKVPYDASTPVHTFWDLGFSDMTSIWFVQKVGFEYRVIDFYQNNLQWLPHYIEVLQSKKYLYGTDFLPHDGRNKQLAGESIEDQCKKLGRNDVKIVPRAVKTLDDIQKTRMVFEQCYFDEEKCSDGLNGLRRYRYDVDDDGRVSRNPRHDQYSHAADAFRTFAIGFKDKIVSKKRAKRNTGNGLGFLGA